MLGIVLTVHTFSTSSDLKTVSFSLILHPLFSSSRWGPVPVRHASAAWLWHHGEAHQAAGQLLPGGYPQDGCLPLRGGHHT